jgi:hypothetical protein
MPNGEIISAEWQSAYVIENHNSAYFFYWHLGREDPDDPTTNHIIEAFPKFQFLGKQP